MAHPAVVQREKNKNGRCSSMARALNSLRPRQLMYLHHRTISDMINSPRHTASDRYAFEA
eukprot:1352158-Amphidinium_carterae.1